jgi:hypothetical protein
VMGGPPRTASAKQWHTAITNGVVLAGVILAGRTPVWRRPAGGRCPLGRFRVRGGRNLEFAMSLVEGFLMRRKGLGVRR